MCEAETTFQTHLSHNSPPCSLSSQRLGLPPAATCGDYFSLPGGHTTPATLQEKRQARTGLLRSTLKKTHSLLRNRTGRSAGEAEEPSHHPTVQEAEKEESPGREWLNSLSPPQLPAQSGSRDGAARAGSRADWPATGARGLMGKELAGPSAHCQWQRRRRRRRLLVELRLARCDEWRRSDSAKGRTPAPGSVGYWKVEVFRGEAVAPRGDCAREIRHPLPRGNAPLLPTAEGPTVLPGAVTPWSGWALRGAPRGGREAYLFSHIPRCRCVSRAKLS